MSTQQKQWLDNYLKTHTWRDLFMLQYEYLKKKRIDVVKIISQYAKERS